MGCQVYLGCHSPCRINRASVPTFATITTSTFVITASSRKACYLIQLVTQNDSRVISFYWVWITAQQQNKIICVANFHMDNYSVTFNLSSLFCQQRDQDERKLSKKHAVKFVLENVSKEKDTGRQRRRVSGNKWIYSGREKNGWKQP